MQTELPFVNMPQRPVELRLESTAVANKASPMKSQVHEIEILRRVLFEVRPDQLKDLRASFEETPELFGEDQEAIDLIDWLMKRREML
jgi:hypothetical protein